MSDNYCNDTEIIVNLLKFQKEKKEHPYPGIWKSDFRPVKTDLDFLGPFYFAKNVKKIGPKINLFSVEYLN